MLTSANPRLMAWGVTVLRVVVGIVFALHGGQKVFQIGYHHMAESFGQAGIPVPAVSAVLVMAAESLCGLALALGLFTRLAAFPLAFTMLVAFLKVHMRNGFFLPKGFEYVLVLFSVMVMLMLTGSGALSLDNLLARRRKPAP